MRKLPIMALVCLVLAAAPAPASELEGPFVFASVQMLEPTNVSMDVGRLEEDEVGGVDRGQRLAIDFSQELTPMLGFGYSWGDQGRLSISYWDFGSDESLSVAKGSGWSFIGPAFGDEFSEFDIEDSLQTRVSARGEIEATQFALEFAKDHTFENEWTITWFSGLRYVQYEEKLLIEALWNDFGDIFTQQLRWKQESDGYGATMGFGAAHHVTGTLSLRGALKLTYAWGEVKSSAYQELVFDEFDSFDEETGVSTEDSSGLITDIELGLDWTLTDHFGFALMLTHSSWDDLVTRFNGPSEDGMDDTSLPTRDNVSFSGLSVVMRYTFGG